MAGEIIAENINLEEVGRFFESKGYKVRKLVQLWRHVTGEVFCDNERLFLKLASTQEIGEKTRNERVWNENVNTIWKKQTESFRSPKVFDEGIYEKKYWFVCEHVFGKPLAEVSKPGKDILKTDLERAAAIAKDIVMIGEKTLLPNDKRLMMKNVLERYLSNAREWSKNTKADTKQILQFIEENKQTVEIGSCHGDFTPWAIMKTKTKQYYLIDGESSKLSGVKHYDAAYFYHRVYAKYKRPDLAESFLQSYKKIMKFNETETEAFNAVLASRIMGGYFDAERDGVTSIELNKEMETKLLKKP